MKNKRSALPALLLVAALLFQVVCLAACGGDVTTAKTPESAGTTEAPENTAPESTAPETEAPDPVESYDNLPRSAAAEGMVLLVNKNNSLPLKPGATVAIFGAGQINTVKGGTGSGDVTHAETVNFLTGMEEKESEGKIRLYQALAARYKANPNTPVSPAIAKAAAQAAENAVYIITRNAGEGSDRSAGRGDYLLSESEKSALKIIIAAGFQNITVILNVGGVVDTSELLAFPEVRSILLAWQPGQEGGRAMADLLVGDETPCGKLADTFAKSYDDYPTTKTFGESLDYVKYEEDIFVGYRWFETFDPTYEKVNFEFGFGLSYTDFSFSSPTVTEKNDSLEVTVTVTNTGDTYSGKEVVQLYYAAPQGKLGKPARELGAFAKTKTLAPGESQTLTLCLPIADMASYDDTGKVQKSAWVLEAGSYQLYLGNSIRNAKENGAFYTYTLEKDKVVEQLTEQLTAKLLEKRLLADGSYETVYDDSGIGVVLTTAPTRIEAEHFYAKHCHAEVRFNATATICGVKTLTSDAGDRYVTFAFEVETAGDYQIALGIGNGGAFCENAVRFYVNGVSQGGALSLPGTRGEFLIEEVGGATVHFEKGLNFLKILFVCGDKFTGLLDYITLTYGKTSAETPAAGEVSSAAPVTASEKSAAATAARAKILWSDVVADPSLLDAFIAQLTPEQLAYLLHGHGENIPNGTGSIGGLAEYGIPSAETADGPAGLNLSVKTTAWPIETLLACTWNTGLLEAVGRAVGEEAAANRVDLWLAPGMNIHRNPLCGRNFEYYSEDPFLTGTMAAALTAGVQSKGVGVTLKHFACNEKENNRGYSDSRVSERALREIYLKAFELCVKKAEPWAVMTSYNKINGTETDETAALIRQILRKEWGYTGLVMTDWWNDSVQYKELLAGNNLKMKSGDEAGVLGALKAGVISRDLLEENVKYILELILKSKASDRVGEEAAIEIQDGAVITSVEASWKSGEIGMEACEDTTGGFNTTNTYEGQWLIFVIDVKEAGRYTVNLRIASENGTGAIDFLVDDRRAGSLRNTVKTGAWQKWATSNGSITLNLTQGVHTLRLNFTQGGFNINTLTFHKN